MEHVHILKVVMEVFPLIGSEDAKGETDQCPEVNNPVICAKVFTELMDLCVAVVTGCNAVVCLGGLDLVVLCLAVDEPFFLESGLEEPTSAAAAEVVGLVRGHVDEIFFTHNGFDYKSKVLCNGISIGFTNDLAGILDRELDLEILVPVRIYLEFAFPDPACIVLVDVFNFKAVLDVKFFQSCQD